MLSLLKFGSFFSRSRQSALLRRHFSVPPHVKSTWCSLLTEHALQNDDLLAMTPDVNKQSLPTELAILADEFLSKCDESTLTPDLKDQFILYVASNATISSSEASTSQVAVSNAVLNDITDPASRLVVGTESPASSPSSVPSKPVSASSSSSSASSSSLASVTHTETPASPFVPYDVHFDRTRQTHISRAMQRAKQSREQCNSLWLATQRTPSADTLGGQDGRTFQPVVGGEAPSPTTTTTTTTSMTSTGEAPMIPETDVKLDLQTELSLSGTMSDAKYKASFEATFGQAPRLSNALYQIHVPYLLKSSEELELLSPKEREQVNFEDELFLEQLALETALHEYSQTVEQMFKMGKGSDLRGEQRIVATWYPALVDRIHRDLQMLADDQAAEKANGPVKTRRLPSTKRLDLEISVWEVLMRIDPAKLAVITLQTLMNQFLSSSHIQVTRSVAILTELSGALRTQLYSQILQAEDPKVMETLKRQKKLTPFHMVSALREEDLEAEEKNPNKLLKTAGYLLRHALACCHIPTVRPDGSACMQPAFRLRMMMTRLPSYIGILQPHPGLIDLLRRSHINAAGLGLRSLPMVTPPRLWTSASRGSYLTQRINIMRTHGNRQQMDVLFPAEINRVYRGLNCLSSVKWKINTSVLDTIQYFWNQGRGFGEIPTMQDFEVPLEPKENEGKQGFVRRRFAIMNQNLNLHSLRMSMKYRIEQAEMFRHRHFYLPHSLDFRGRAYPLPPHLNQMGSDATRALLLFSSKRPLGERGIFWLKVQIANLYGMDKFDFPGRVAWVDKNMDKIVETAEAPVHGSRWWQAADKPFQFMAACIELISALNSGDPTQFLSDLPVHQDGSCNGLQHYAALGRDEWGGAQVNLIDSEKPQDVYSGVCAVVRQKIEMDAATGDSLAQLLSGKVDRKTVKQTVMTSVYGVTYIGARDQILNRLKERKDIPWPEPADQSMKKAANYIAKLAFESLGDVFKGAWGIMEWLTQCAQLIASTGQPVSWLTPLGLPVIQPYRAVKSYQVDTAFQKVTLAEHSDLLPVNKSKQRSAFPPNYVHSLDSTHMLMTAMECRLEKGLEFAAVHDSYWTHAGAVDIMNESLRRQFITMHSMPLLENLRESLVLRFPNIRFPQLPARGKLDLNQVMKSQFFFD